MTNFRGVSVAGWESNLLKRYFWYFLKNSLKMTITTYSSTQPAKLDLNKKSFPKQKTIQNFTIDAQGFRKTKNENPLTWEMGVTS